MADTIIQALREYFLTCPLMGKSKINVDFLPEKGIEYSIDTTPATEIIKRYVNGDTRRQYLFVIRSVNDYGSDALQNVANSGFYEQLAAWLEEQTNAENFPQLPPGMEPESIEAQSTGYLFTAGPKSGRYQIQCRLIYLQKG
ncbi:MAG: hypothetical protein LKJ17_12150 [Oscillospiraceae bacterium]|jgi:hypothetical protein|nr:hypothetical protein [Oscillospiraceae bacterium]